MRHRLLPKSASFVLSLALIVHSASAATFETEPGVHVYHTDEGQGLALLFVPGWTMTTEVFAAQRTSFSRTQRVVSMDPRGQGRSSKDSPQHTYVQQGHDIDKLIRHLGLKKVVLIAWSYGCLAGYAYARHHGRENIAAFVCIDQSPHPLQLDDGPNWTEGPLQATRTFFDDINYRRADFSAAFAQWMVKRKLEPAEVRWLSDMSESTPTGIAIQLAADGLFSDYRHELRQLSREMPMLQVLSEGEAPKAKPWLEAIAWS